MNNLKGKSEPYAARDGGTILDPKQREKMLANFMAPTLLVLRIDAQVMLIKNMDESLVNGTTGKVVDFVDPATYGRDGEDITGERKATATLGQGKLYPVVEFLLPNGCKKNVLVLPESWKVELPSGEVQVSRTQVSYCSLGRLAGWLNYFRSPLFSRGRCQFTNLKDRRLNESKLTWGEYSRKVRSSHDQFVIFVTKHAFFST